MSRRGTAHQGAFLTIFQAARASWLILGGSATKMHFLAFPPCPSLWNQKSSDLLTTAQSRPVWSTLQHGGKQPWIL